MAADIDMATFEINRETYDHFNAEKLVYRAKPGINEEIVREISRQKNEPEWMLQKRLEGYRAFMKLKMPE